MDVPKDALKMARVVAINISVKKGTPKISVPAARLIEDYGLEGDAHAGKWHRQVSLLGMESINRMAALGVTGLAPGSFAENITTENIELFKLQPGDRLILGETILEVTQIGKECHQKCAIFHQIGKCAMPEEGIFARVLQGGFLRTGDTIRLE